VVAGSDAELVALVERDLALVMGVHGAPILARVTRSIGQMRGENFPVVLRLLPRRPRTQLARVYAFARFVDEVEQLGPIARSLVAEVIDEAGEGIDAGQLRAWAAG